MKATINYFLLLEYHMTLMYRILVVNNSSLSIVNSFCGLIVELMLIVVCQIFVFKIFYPIVIDIR